MLMIICTWKSQRMGTSNLKLMPHSWTWGCTTFHNFLWMWKKNEKLAGLWLAGEVVNHVGIYGSKAAEGLSAFQRRSCLYLSVRFNYHNHLMLNYPQIYNIQPDTSETKMKICFGIIVSSWTKEKSRPQPLCLLVIFKGISGYPTLDITDITGDSLQLPCSLEDLVTVDSLYSSIRTTNAGHT